MTTSYKDTWVEYRLITHTWVKLPLPEEAARAR
jgi:hypothetical protein